MQSRGIIDLRRKRPGIDSLIPVRFNPQGPRRRSPLRARRRKLRAVLALLVLLILAGAAYGISWASYLPQYNIQHVAVSGTRALSPELVRSFVESRLDEGSYPLLSPKNIFLFHPGAVADELADFFPRIKSAAITRESLLSTAIAVSVEERAAFGRWCNGTGGTACYLLDDTGFLFAGLASTTESGAYIFRGDITRADPIGEMYASPHFSGIRALLTLLGQSGFTPEGAEIREDHDFLVQLQDGFYLKASFGQDANSLVKNLKLVLNSETLAGKESDLEYVDLRFGNKVYYKMKTGEEMQAE